MPIIELDHVTHPLLGRRLPTLESLIERCDPEATRTLECAVGLARARIELQARALDMARQLQHDPWAERRLHWPEPPHALTSTDVLRALLALHAERVAEIAFFPDDVSERFKDASTHWRNVAASVASERSVLGLEAVWARRWALANDEEPIGRDTLIANLAPSSVRTLATFDRRYTEELITDDEAFQKLVDHMAGMGGFARSAWPMPAAYWDRHGGLSELDRLLARGPGVVVVGPEGSGRHALLETWEGRFRDGEGPAPLRGFGCNRDNFHGAGMIEWRGAKVTSLACIDTRCIAILSNFGSELDSSELETRRFPGYCIEFASDPANDFRLVPVVTPDELERLEDRLPMLRSFPKLAVPAISDDEALAMWVCRTLRLEEQLSVSLPIWRLVDRLVSRSPGQRRNFDACGDLICSTELSGHENALRRLAESASRGTWGPREIEQLTRRVARDPALASWLDVRCWPSQVRLDDALRRAK